MRRKLTLFFFLLLGCIGIASAQSTITGTVTDKSGQSLPGVTVRVRGTSSAAATDINGKYKISTPPNATLVFSFVGFTNQAVAVGDQSVVNVTLTETTNSLNDVVVVGYGTQRKSVTTGAIAGVTAKEFEDQPVTRIEQILQGRTAGVTVGTSSGQPGDGGSVRVRGITSFNNNDPLWVVDGVVVDNGGIGYLNQSDIQSIEVLKDAASQAIYGTRAAAGVILVTTKKGQSGRLQINYSGWVGTQAPARKLDLLNATQYATLLNESSVNAGGAVKFANPASLGQGTDWQSQIFNNSAIKQNHELSVSGGGDKSTFYTSFGYLDQKGIVASPISQYKRINFRVNETYKPAKWLTFGENIGYTYNKTLAVGNTNSEFGGPLSSAINLDPTTPVLITDANLASQSPYNNTGIVRNAQGYPYAISSNVGQEINNPLAYIQTRLGNYNWAHNIVGNAYAEVEPIKGLKFRSTLGTKLSFYGSEAFTPVSYLNSSTITSQNNYNRQSTRLTNWNLENTVSYTKTFGKHNLNVLLGQGAYSDNNSYSTGAVYYNLPVNTFNDASLNYNIPATQRIANGSEGQEHHVSSLFARLNYDYQEKYIFQGIIRRDGSSRFGANYKYGNFPSFSLGWVPTKESFWPENKVVDFLKVRGGYGVVGSDAIADNAFLSTIGSGRNYSFGTGDTYLIGYSPNAPSNPNLKWEQTAQTNIGIDAVLFNDFTITLEWFKKKTTGILQNPPIPFYTGAISNPAANVGDMSNSGQELSIGYHRNVGKFKLGFDGNVSHLKNEVTYLGNAQQYLDGAGFQNIQGGITRTTVGQPYGAFFGYENLGIFQTQSDINTYVSSKGTRIQPNARPGDFKFADINGDGQITDADRNYIGNPFPSWQFGFTFTAAYNNFDFLVFAQGQAGNKIFQGLRRLDITNANYNTRALTRWTGPGTSNTYPILVDGDPDGNFNRNSSFYLENGSYLRFKTIQLGYTLPKSLIGHVGMQRARVYVSGENLITLTKYDGYDPDISGSVDRGYYPQARTFLVGLSVGF